MANMLNNRAKDPTHAVFGRTLDGETYSACISDGPHWLVCGETGSGKSVYLNAMLISMMAHSHPDELKITWVDPKMVEAAAYVGNPFCPVDPVQNMSDAYGFIMFLAWEMDRRYSIFKDLQVKNIGDYNTWIEKNPEEAATKNLGKMPWFVCVVDEYAELVAVEPQVEDGIKRLGAKARAAGIHLVIATQRPSADVINTTLRSNIPGRVGLKVDTSTSSQIVIGESGCEELRGYGDSLVTDKGGGLSRVQGPFIPDDEIASIFAHIRDKYPDREFIDYKQLVVDQGICQWQEDYTDDVDWEDRHVVKAKKRPR